MIFFQNEKYFLNKYEIIHKSFRKNMKFLEFFVFLVLIHQFFVNGNKIEKNLEDTS